MLLPETLALHDKEKFEFYYLYFLPWKNQVVGDIEANGGKVTCIPASNNAKIILAAPAIASFVKKNKIQVIHCHLPWAGITGRLAGKIAKVPVVYTEHNKWERYHKLTYFLNKVTFKWQKMAIPCSYDVEESVRKHYHKKTPLIKTISNGVNTIKFNRADSSIDNLRAQLGIDTNTKVIGIISVFRVQKRLTDWLEIAAKIHEKRNDTFFIVVGDGPLKEEVHSKAKELSMDSYIYFAGLQSEVRPYLKTMDIFMMTSKFEGLPIALLEAMSMECIPACTAAGGIPEVVNDNKNGILVPVDEQHSLVGQITKLVSEFDTRQSLRTEARTTVEENFSLRKMVDKLEDVYRTVLN